MDLNSNSSTHHSDLPDAHARKKGIDPCYQKKKTNC
jgi:hypothetical protein